MGFILTRPKNHNSSTNAPSVGTDAIPPLAPKAPTLTVLQSLKAILVLSWLNVLLPVAWALHSALPPSNTKDSLVFVFSFLAIIPLSRLSSFATKLLTMRLGKRLARLMNATFGNPVELIVAIIALLKCELSIVQSSLLGLILSNLLLVPGICLFIGGLAYSEQGFSASATQLDSSLLTISVIAVLLPAAFIYTANPQLSTDQEGKDILAVSRGVSVILLCIYAGFLHITQSGGGIIAKYTASSSRPWNYLNHTNEDRDAESYGVVASGSASTVAGAERSKEENEAILQKELKTTHTMNLWITIGLFVVVMVLVAVTAEWLVDSINGLTSTGHINKVFVGIILLPIVSGAAEHYSEFITALDDSVKDKLTLSIEIAVGSSIRLALFVIPLFVILGWILGKPLTLLFDPYQCIVLFLSVLTVNYVVQDAKSKWLEGLILMSLYLIAAVTFWYHPGFGQASRKCT